MTKIPSQKNARGAGRRASSIISFAVAPALLLALAGWRGSALREARHAGAHGGAGAAELAGGAGAAGAPPMVEFVNVALGGFRGLVADLLWMRVGRLQEERRFVELAQLSDWITKLEPGLSEVWEFHSWNMAYNISVIMTRPEDRWLWVRNGIELLRDSALRINPNDATLQRALGWIFQHKLAMDSDRFSPWYRARWVVEMDAYLGENGAIPGDDDFLAAELENNFSMEPATMREIEARFGSIDWRLPSAQALYWAWRGLRTAAASKILPCRRMIYTAISDMAYRHGILDGDLSADDYIFAARPNTALIESGADFFEETMSRHEFNGIRFAYVGFLRNAIVILARDGEAARSRAAYERMKTFFRDKITRPLPPYEQALHAPDEFYQALMFEAGYK